MGLFYFLLLVLLTGIPRCHGQDESCRPERSRVDDCSIRNSYETGQLADCFSCLNDALDISRACNDVQGNICPAIETCTSCSQCGEELEYFMTCFIRDNGCSGFSCSTPDCSAAANLVANCALQNGFTQSRLNTCDECLLEAESLSNRCEDLSRNVCPALDSCSSCSPCGDELEQFFNCTYNDETCDTEFTCAGPLPPPTPPPPPPPTPAPSRCPGEVDSVIRCTRRNGFSQNQFDGCIRCLAEAEARSNLCVDLQGNVCPAFTTCTDCSPCEDDMEAFLSCTYRSEGCTGFTCDGPLPPPSPPSPTPAPAPMIATPCQAKADTVNLCISRNGFTQIRFDSCVNCITEAESLSNFCLDLQRHVCPAFDYCRECHPCQDDIEDFMTCVYNNSGCSGFACPISVDRPTPAPVSILTPAPNPVADPVGISTPSPVMTNPSPVCQAQDSAISECLLSSAVTALQAANCASCVSTALSAGSMGCSSLTSTCETLNDCNSCDACRDPIDEFIVCKMNDCEFDCPREGITGDGSPSRAAYDVYSLKLGALLLAAAVTVYWQ